MTQQPDGGAGPRQTWWCERAVTGSGAQSGVRLAVAGGRFVDVQPGAEPPPGAERLSGWVVPGFVDTHVHGGGGHAYTTTDPDEARQARAFHRRHGTTTSVASLVTAELDTLVAQLHALAPLVRSGEFVGIHLEGPFLSPARKGAHNEALLRAPTPEAVDRLLEAADGTVRMVTIAPELDGALDAVARFVANGAAVAIGHTEATPDDVRRALDAGATVATHLFNGMPPVHHREPGPVPVLLTDERVLIELIADGFHLHPDVVRMAVDAAGLGRSALITDAMIATGMPDGRYPLGDLEVAVTQGQARLVLEDGSPGSIAGSTLTMAGGFGQLLRSGLSVPGAAWLAATSPAAWHGMDEVGVIEVGRAADLCVLDETGRLQRVMQKGEWVR